MVEFTKTIKDPLGLHARPLRCSMTLSPSIAATCRSASATAIPTVATLWASWLSTASAARTSSSAFRA